MSTWIWQTSMGEYFGYRPNGTPVHFLIKGDKPSPTETARINAYLTQGPPKTAAEPKPPEEEPPGVMSVLGSNIARGYNEIQAGVDTAIQSAFEGLGDTARAKEWQEAAEAQRAERDAYGAPEGSILDPGTNKLHAVVGTIGQSAPSMALGLAGMGAGASVGASIGAFGGPIGAGIGGILGGVIGGALGYTPQMLNANAERQIEQFGYVKDWDKAYISTTLGAGVETVTDRLGLRVVGALWDGAKIAGKAVSRTSEKAVREASKNAVDKAMTVVAKRVGTGMALGAVTGAAEEVMQANLERWQAELPLMDDAAKKEYLESAIMGGIVESLFGAGAGTYGAHKQIQNQKALAEADADIDAESAKATSAASTYGPQYEALRNPPPPPAPPAPPTEPLRTEPIEGQKMLPDFSAPTREQTYREESEGRENRLPPGLRDEEVGTEPLKTAAEEVVTTAPVSEATRGPKPFPELPPIPGEAPSQAFLDYQKKLAEWEASATGPVSEEAITSAVRGKAPPTDAEITADIRSRLTPEERAKLDRLKRGPKPFPELPPIPGEAPSQAFLDYQKNLAAWEAGAPPATAAPPVPPVTPIAPAATTPNLPEPRIGEQQGPPVPPFSDTDYRNAIDTLRDEGVLSIDKIKNVLGVSRPQAEAYFAEMLKRNDAYPAGDHNQYAQITVPRGMSSRKQHNVRGKMKGHRSRDYIVKPVRPATGAQPFSVHMNNKRQGKKNNTFTTREEAQAWIEQNIPAGKQKDAAIVEDNTNLQYGIHELQYEHLPNREERLVGEQVVNTFMTEAEAQEAIKDYDPAYSPQSNKQRTEQKAPEERAAAINRDFAQETGAIGEQLKAYGEGIVGTGRMEVGIVPRIVSPDNDGIIEGRSEHIRKADPQSIRKIIGNLITLSNDLYNPKLTEEQRTKLMQEVMNHELVHALRSLDLLTTQEWDTLFQHAANAKVPGKRYTWLQRAMVRTGYLKPLKPGEKRMDPQALAEEAVAEMVRHYINDPTAFRNPQRGLLRKIGDFIKKMMRLGERHDAADLIDTIFSGGIADRQIGHGGLGPRGWDDVQFSLLKTDNFYLETERFLQKVTTDEAPKNHWIKMLSSAGIKQEELNWLGIKQWLQDIPVEKGPEGRGGMVHRNDILNFVKASGPDVKPVIFAKQEHPDLAQAAVMDPRWEEKSQVVQDKTYAEVAFTVPGREGEPVYYDSGGHMKVPGKGDTLKNLGNVIAFARFRDVIEMINGVRKRILFIEEMQSDLHQQGSMKGYYSKSAVVRLNQMRDEARAAYDEMRRFKSEQVRVADEVWMLQQKEKELRANPNVTETLDQRMDLHKATLAKIGELNDLKSSESAARDRHTELLRDVGDAAKRIEIPNAPFKSNWEDYVIRRMIRHAAEHGYDGIAWHGSPESVAETEGYGDLEVTEDERGKKQYTAYGEAAVGPIINRYMLKLPKIANGIAQPFGATIDHNKVDRSHIPPKWTPEEWGQPEVTEDLGEFAEDPLEARRERLRAAFEGPGDLRGIFNQLNSHHNYGASHGWYKSEADEKLATDLLAKLKRARQVAMNRRGPFDAPSILETAGIRPDEIDHILSWSENNDFYAGPMAEKGKAGFEHDNYRLNFNRDMKQSFEQGNQPFFSMIRERKEQIMADPKFQNWFGQGVVTDDDNTPKVVYHYSNSDQDFGRFNKLSHFGTATAANERFKLKAREAFAISPQHRDAALLGSRIYPAFLNLRRPLHIKDDKSHHNAFSYGLAMREEGVLTDERFREIMAQRTDAVNNYTPEGEQAALTDIVKEMEKAGYDGFSYINAGEDMGAMSYIALHPQQIKSIFNQGEWSEDPDTMYSRLEARGADLLADNDKFKHWFSGSRVVNEDGNPWLVFTGTSKDTDFNVFKAARNGIWFTDDPAEASQYAVENDSMGYAPDPSSRDPWAMRAKNTAARVVPAFLSIKNPYIFKDAELDAWVRDPSNANYKRAQGILFDRLKASGHDGVKWGDKTWIAFEGGQVKSALAEEFSTEDNSFKYSMIRPLYSAAAPLGQRVPATPPIDRLSEVHNRITYDNISPVVHKLIDWAVPGASAKAASKSFVDDSIVNMQDRMLSVGRLIDRMKKNGGFITNENDTYLREQLYSSQVDALLTANNRDYYKKMMDTITGLHVTQRDVDEAKTIDEKVATILKQYKNPKHALAELYVYAQHARERNLLMRQRNERIAGDRPQQYEAGSGLGDGTAQAVLDWFASKPFAREFNDPTNDNSVRSRMRAIIKNTNDIRVQSGLTRDFRTMIHPDGRPMDIYEDYAPIRGRIDEEATWRGEDDINEFFGKTGKGFNIRGKEDFSALGRESLGRDLIGNAILQNQETIVRAGKNKVVQSFRQLILDNPAAMSEVAEIIDRGRTKYTYDTKTGVVRQTTDTKMMTDPMVLKGKHEGQQFYIQMKDPRIAKAMGSKSGLGNSTGMNSLMKGMLGVNRFLAATRTSWNPEFVVSNVMRDLQSAMVNLTEQGRKDVRRKVVASVFPAMKGVWQSVRSGNMTNEWAKVHEEFRRHGGHTSVMGIRQMSDSVNRINKELAQDVSGNINKVKKPIKAIFDFMNDYNLAAENGTRLAAYKILRDQYLELSGDPHNPQNQLRAREMAAFAAKNMTVNFDMGGEYKGNMTAAYMFFNASIQGTAAMLNTAIRSPRVRKMWAGIIVAGAVQDMLMSMLSPEDDDGEKTYDKIPEHVLEHNWILMDPFGLTERGYFQFPMPYLMNGLYNFGRASSRAARGKYTAGELLSTGGMTLIDSLNPLGAANNFLNTVMPSVLDPVVDLTLNEDFTGKPIAPPLSPYDAVHENRSQQYWSNTNPLYITVADLMSQLTGRQGDFIPGTMEASPNQIEYVVNWVTGGTGTFLARASWLAGGVATGDFGEMEVSDIPFVRKGYGSITERNDLQDYIEGRDQVLRIRKALQDARKDGDNEGYMEIMRKYPNEYKIAARVNAIENARKKLGSRIKKIRDSKNLTDEEKEIRVKELKARQDLMVGRGNEAMAAID